MINTLGRTLDPLGAIPEWSSEAIAQRVSEAGGNYSRPIRNTDVSHRFRVMEAARLMSDAIEGRIDPFLFKQAMNPTHQVYVDHLKEMYPGIFRTDTNRIGLRETMSYSDYSALTVDVLDRMLYGYYSAAPITNLPLVKKHPLRDFRLVARYEMDGGTKPFSQMPNDFPALNPHGAGEPPTERSMQQAARETLGSTQRTTYQPQLYQGLMSVNWRALINDDLGIFRDMVQRLAISGNRTIYQFITMLYVASTGGNTTLFNSTFANLVTAANSGGSTNNPALSWQGLLDAKAVLSRQLDSDGQPITFDGTLYLVTGSGAIANTAISMAKALQVDISVGGGTTNAQGFPSQRLRTENWPMSGVTPIEDKYAPLICTTSGVKDTQWWLFYDPSAQARPPMELGQLQGFETPQLFQEIPTTMRVGGAVDPMLGNFYTMNQNYKGILVLGGTQLDGRSCVYSTGQGV